MIAPKNDITMMEADHPTAAVAMPQRRRSVSVVSATTSSRSSRAGGSPKTAAAAAAAGQQQQRRKSTSLPSETVEYLKNWMMSPEHIAHPYPTEREKAEIMADTGIELKQLTNWFVNNRKRFWKPRVEARGGGGAALVTTGAALVTAVSPSRRATTASASIIMDSPSPQSMSTATLTHVISSPSVMTLVEKAMMNMAAASASPMSSAAVTSFTQQGPSMVRGVSPMSSPTQERTFVSEQSSSSFDSSGSVSSMEDGGQDQQHRPVVLGCAPAMPISLTLRSEKVDIHVLRPIVADQEEPSLEDVITTSNVPEDRKILATFQGCDVTYNVPDVADGEMEQSRHDAELVRVKKQCLEMFLSQQQYQHQHAGIKRARSDDDDKEEDEVDVVEPRPRFRRKSIEVWKEACLEADRHGFYSTCLPSLEEATKLFGYSQAD